MRQAFLLFLALSFAAGAVEAQDKFQRKSGLWEVKRTSTRTSEQTRVYQMCIDQASDNALRQLAEGMRNERCEPSKVTRDGDKIVVDAVCRLGRTGSKATTHAVVTGKFDSAYKIESKSTFDPPIQGKTQGNTLMEAKWTGPCKAGQSPGDVILPNGAKMSVTPDDKAAANTDKAPRKHGEGHGTDSQKGGYMPPMTK